MTDALWALKYVNGQQYMARIEGQWCLRDSLNRATLYRSSGEAEDAREVLLRQAKQNVGEWETTAWWHVCGGVVDVVRVDVIEHVSDEPKP